MSREDLSIVVVEGPSSGGISVHDVLSAQGYTDVRVAPGAQDALKMLEERRADVILADWDGGTMDGLALTDRVRHLDEEQGRHTFVGLIGEEQEVQTLIEAFDRGLDDYLPRPLHEWELAVRVYAAGHSVAVRNDLLEAMRGLRDELERSSTIDSLTGIGNAREMERRLIQFLEVTAARGGATCVGVIQVQGLEELAAEHGEQARDELLRGFATRLRFSVRPLDLVVRLGFNEFGLAQYHAAATEFRAQHFRRILHALNLRPYKTSAGFLGARSAFGLYCVRENDEPMGVADVLQHARAKAEEARLGGCKNVVF